MKRRVLIRPAADRDLDEQAEYLAAHQSLEMALRYYRAAEQTFRLLASQPKIGKVAACRSPFLAGISKASLRDKRTGGETQQGDGKAALMVLMAAYETLHDCERAVG